MANSHIFPWKFVALLLILKYLRYLRKHRRPVLTSLLNTISYQTKLKYYVSQLIEGKADFSIKIWLASLYYTTPLSLFILYLQDSDASHWNGFSFFHIGRTLFIKQKYSNLVSQRLAFKPKSLIPIKNKFFKSIQSPSSDQMWRSRTRASYFRQRGWNSLNMVDFAGKYNCIKVLKEHLACSWEHIRIGTKLVRVTVCLHWPPSFFECCSLTRRKSLAVHVPNFWPIFQTIMNKNSSQKLLLKLLDYYY